MSFARVLVALSACVLGAAISLQSLHSSEVQPRMAVVSAQFGVKGKIIEQLPDLPADVHGFFYTDAESATNISTGAGWSLVTRAYHLEDGKEWSQFNTHGKYSLSRVGQGIVRGVMSARFYKTNMHLLPELQDFDLIFWTDSCHRALRLLKTYNSVFSAERGAKALGSNDFLLNWHEERTRVKQEVEAAARRGNLNTGVSFHELHEEMEEAWRVLQSKGFKDDVGLIRTEQFLFRARSPTARKAMAAWWEFLQDYTFRDQISFPWAMNSNKATFTAPCQARDILGGSCILKEFCLEKCETPEQEAGPMPDPPKKNKKRRR